MTQMDMIKNELSEHIGKEVIVKANRGRKRIVTRKGVLQAVYPSLFVVSIASDERTDRNISFTYADVLTSTVKIMILEEDANSADLKIS
ncbi:Veg family protein [Aedoeadaptatus urinae]|uniref:Veg family protein n=1 Tax=Aedoeadaptatus urinae TaxID=1871017 RepID=UPI00097D1276|nr:Veg family protein [Peptoniphilus urinae]